MAPSSSFLLLSVVSLLVVAFILLCSSPRVTPSQLGQLERETAEQAVQLNKAVKELNKLLDDFENLKEKKKDQLPSQKKKESVLIFYDGDAHGYWPDWAIELTGMSTLVKDCPVKCKYTSDPSAYEYSDAVLHFCLGMKHKRNDGKISVVQCTEPFVNDDREHLTFNPEVSLKDFDVSMTYDPKVATVPMTFGVWPADTDTFCNVQNWLKEVVKAKTTKSSTNPSCFFAANCDSKRTEYVKEMMMVTGVDSYGPCLHNTDDDSGSHNHNGFDLLMARSSSHKFCLAFDKQQTVGYISERLPLAYRSGCVPVYWGAGDADDYEPGEHSYINANRFASATELGQYLNYLDKNDTAYEEYFAWKKKPLSKNYLDYIQHTHCASICNLCVKVSELRKERAAGN